VVASHNQLDPVAHLLQQYRHQLQHVLSQPDAAAAAAAAGATSQGLLLNPDVLDELLLLLFIQAQIGSGDWAQGLALFQQLRRERGPHFAAGNGTLHGAVIELLVGRGGPEGLLNAMQIVAECHAIGECSYTFSFCASRHTSSPCA
jgi:hypothetical protein